MDGVGGCAQGEGRSGSEISEMQGVVAGVEGSPTEEPKEETRQRAAMPGTNGRGRATSLRGGRGGGSLFSESRFSMRRRMCLSCVSAGMAFAVLARPGLAREEAPLRSAGSKRAAADRRRRVDGFVQSAFGFEAGDARVVSEKLLKRLKLLQTQLCVDSNGADSRRTAAEGIARVDTRGAVSSSSLTNGNLHETRGENPMQDGRQAGTGEEQKQQIEVDVSQTQGLGQTLRNGFHAGRSADGEEEMLADVNATQPQQEGEEVRVGVGEEERGRNAQGREVLQLAPWIGTQNPSGEQQTNRIQQDGAGRQSVPRELTTTEEEGTRNTPIERERRLSETSQSELSSSNGEEEEDGSKSEDAEAEVTLQEEEQMFLEASLWEASQDRERAPEGESSNSVRTDSMETQNVASRSEAVDASVSPRALRLPIVHRAERLIQALRRRGGCVEATTVGGTSQGLCSSDRNNLEGTPLLGFFRMGPHPQRQEQRIYELRLQDIDAISGDNRNSPLVPLLGTSVAVDDGVTAEDVELQRVFRSYGASNGGVQVTVADPLRSSSSSASLVRDFLQQPHPQPHPHPLPQPHQPSSPSSPGSGDPSLTLPFLQSQPSAVSAASGVSQLAPLAPPDGEASPSLPPSASMEEVSGGTRTPMEFMAAEAGATGAASLGSVTVEGLPSSVVRSDGLALWASLGEDASTMRSPAAFPSSPANSPVWSACSAQPSGAGQLQQQFAARIDAATALALAGGEALRREAEETRWRRLEQQNALQRQSQRHFEALLMKQHVKMEGIETLVRRLVELVEAVHSSEMGLN